jgi:intracellular sulfur oxidation DsrE/DsrF family protein
MPSTFLSRRLPAHQVFLGNVVLYKNIKYEVLDEITSSRHDGKYVIANRANYSEEKTLTKDEVKVMFDDGAVTIFLEDEDETEDEDELDIVHVNYRLQEQL